ncbi:MAG: STAS domain-containing protein, partial [Clostridia bacterium]|nr:STAS domain-containing protein [Clostridia bacterium]
MKIEKVQKDDLLTVSLDGRLDTLTAPELAKELNESLPKAQKLTLDFKNLEYISSSGLRVLLSAQREMVKKGG